MSPRRFPRPRRGFALVAAMALLVLGSVVALALSEVARARRLTTANAAEHAAAVAAARAGLDEARLRLLEAQMASIQRGRPDPVWQADPWARQVGRRIGPVALGPLRYDVSVEDAGAKVQLDLADEAQLRALLLALRVDAGRADRVTQAILDWRDGDQLHRRRGAERADYLQAGAAVLPEDAPFRDVATLRHVAGMSEPLLAQLRPYLRVVGGPRVNLNTAPAPVLLSLPGMTDESVALLLRWRRQGRRVGDVGALAAAVGSGARARLTRAMPALAALSAVDTREVLVTSIASRDGVELARAEALMLRDNGVIIRWRRTSP